VKPLLSTVPKAEPTIARKPNQKKIDKHVDYIEVKTQEYLDALKKMTPKITPLKSKIFNKVKD
jgi:hypothetical protein